MKRTFPLLVIAIMLSFLVLSVPVFAASPTFNATVTVRGDNAQLTILYNEHTFVYNFNDIPDYDYYVCGFNIDGNTFNLRFMFFDSEVDCSTLTVTQSCIRYMVVNGSLSNATLNGNAINGYLSLSDNYYYISNFDAFKGRFSNTQAKIGPSGTSFTFGVDDGQTESSSSTDNETTQPSSPDGGTAVDGAVLNQIYELLELGFICFLLFGCLYLIIRIVR